MRSWNPKPEFHDLWARHQKDVTVNDAAFWPTVDKHLIRYGGAFTPRIIERARAATSTTATATRSSTSPPGR